MARVPDSLIEAVRNRIEEATPERENVMAHNRIGRPLEAETDEERKILRVQAATGIDREAARQVANYHSPEALGLTGDMLLRAERIQGRTVDFVGISFVELAFAAASAVARVVFRSIQPQGTGFMISDRLFLTNHHVITSEDDARRFLVEFSHELDVDLQPKAVTRFELAPGIFFMTSPEDGLDFTVVALGQRVSGAGDLGAFGFCPLMATSDKHVVSEFVNIIQHPEGDFKRIVLRESQVVSRLDTVLHYVADTLPGSSGSPVFNDEWEVVALHHWGEPFTETMTPDGRLIRKDVNEGIRISAIAKAMTGRLGDYAGEARSLLEAALNPGFRYPSALKRPARSLINVDREASRPAPPSDYARLRVSADGTAMWTLPLEVSVRVGGTPLPDVSQPLGPATSAAPPPPPLASEAITIDRDYKNRNGYNSDFLPGHRVDLPVLSESQQAQAARLHNPPPGADPHELKYQHFSIVMNAPRRMAYFTAANIDGATWVDIDRDTALPREAAEKWFDDPRIAPEAQCEQSLYDKQMPVRIFDRGHMVRRQDPAWGTPARSIRANADTFHFTNCVPQESQFNQRTQFWQGIENYVLDNAKAEREKVVVMTGPVHRDDDPDYRYVKVPMRFWKILVRVENGSLLATALIADQTTRLPQLPESLREAFSDLSKVSEYQTTIADIEALTGLDFGQLRDHDTFRPGGGEAVGSPNKLMSFEDIHLDAPDAGSRTPARRSRST